MCSEQNCNRYAGQTEFLPRRQDGVEEGWGRHLQKQSSQDAGDRFGQGATD